MRSILLLDSRNKINNDSDGYEFRFKLNKYIDMKGKVKIESFVFQNSEYVFSSKNKSDKFVFENLTTETGPIIVCITGTFTDATSFVQKFNSLMSIYNVKMTYTPELYEFKVMHTGGNLIRFDDFYGESGNFMTLIGFQTTNTGSSFYTNTRIPKMFSYQNIFIYIPEFGTYDCYTSGSKPFTFLIHSKPSFETVIKNNETYSYELRKPITVGELTVQLRNDSGHTFLNAKEDINFKLVLSYDTHRMELES